MKKHSKKKIVESLPMIHSVDFRKLTQELWKLCYSNDVEFYDDDVDINVDNEYFMLFTAVTDNAELHGIMTVKGDKLLVELSEYDGKVLDITDSLLSDDIDTIADYIINSAHAKDVAGITEDYNGSFDTTQTVNEKYYLTWYTEEEEGGPEEGGWSKRVWDVKKSYPFSSKEEAVNYFNNEVVEDGDTVKEIEGGWRIKDGYGDEHLFEIETDATRGQSHEGPRSWEMYELGYKNPVPEFDEKGNRIYGSKRNKKKETRHKIWELVRDFVDDDDDEYWEFDKETSLSIPGEVKLVRDIDKIPRSAKYKFTVSDGLKDVASFYYDYHNDDKGYGCWYVVDSQGSIIESVDESLVDENKDKLVIYKALGEYKVTPKSNYKAQIQNARKIKDAKDFGSAREIIDYYKKYGWADSDDDFEIVDESLNENWCDEKLLELEVKGRDNWDQDDWETYAYCKNANAERDYEDMYNPDIYDYDPMMLEDPAEPSVYEDDYEVWEVEEPDLIDDYEIEEKTTADWKLVDKKTVYDEGGFATDYSWYVNSDGTHIFVFGDSDSYLPENSDIDHWAYSEGEAQEWFDDYYGPGDDDYIYSDELIDCEEYWS